MTLSREQALILSSFLATVAKVEQGQVWEEQDWWAAQSMNEAFQQLMENVYE